MNNLNEIILLLLNNNGLAAMAALLFLLLLILMIIAWWRMHRPSVVAPDLYPYESREKLFTPAERFFLGVLRRVVPEGCLVLGKVRIADVLKVRASLAHSDKTRAFNRISSKHFDFVLCDANTLAILAVIELDDASHRLAAAQARDVFVNGACAAAGLPILHVTVQRQYNVAHLKRQLSHLLRISL